ncbi:MULTISPECIES: glycosyltransferase [Pseudomonas]|nr:MULTISPECIES: glycosyltransferase [Pseudomonas]MDD2109865.1 glycosyltransferase [Pseudomonas asiatica]MDM9587709.1 glycosyltransferase [Pseudomonas asiatica]
MVAMLKPLVSIVIPVFNGANYLEQAVASALQQTYENVEVIVVNDGSSDGGSTERVARKFGSAIRYYDKPNGGVASALNFAIQKMEGRYFSWLSHDDVYRLDKIERQMAYLCNHDLDDVVVYSDYDIFSDDDIDRSVTVRMPAISPRYFRYWITASSQLHGCSLLIPRAVFDKVGGFDESLRTTQDYELWFRMSRYFEFRYLPGVAVAARSHARQDTRKLTAIVQAETSRLYGDFVRQLGSDDIPPDPTAACSYLSLASSLWQRGFRDAALRAETLAISAGAARRAVILRRLLAKLLLLARALARKVISPRHRQSLQAICKEILFRDGR